MKQEPLLTSQDPMGDDNKSCVLEAHNRRKDIAFFLIAIGASWMIHF